VSVRLLWKHLPVARRQQHIVCLPAGGNNINSNINNNKDNDTFLASSAGDGMAHPKRSATTSKIYIWTRH
jgi:hypothetical protein